METPLRRNLTTQRIPLGTGVPTPDLDAAYLLSLAVEKGATAETLSRLFDLRERLVTEQARKDFFAALLQFQSTCPMIQKTKVVRDKAGRERYRYAPLDRIISQVRTLLYEAGLSYTLTAIQDASSLTAEITLAHINGHSERSFFRVPIDKDAYMSEPQKWASASTYAKRVVFCNALGILTGDEDDDTDCLLPEKTESGPRLIAAAIPPDSVMPPQGRPIGAGSREHKRIEATINSLGLSRDRVKDYITRWGAKRKRVITTIPDLFPDEVPIIIDKILPKLKRKMDEQAAATGQLLHETGPDSPLEATKHSIVPVHYQLPTVQELIQSVSRFPKKTCMQWIETPPKGYNDQEVEKLMEAVDRRLRELEVTQHEHKKSSD